jgi:hypothetical protein
MWGALSDEKSSLYFSVFAGNRQRSLSQIWVPRDSYFWDSPNKEGEVPVIISPRNRVAQLYPREYAVEVGTGGIIYLPSFIKTGCK